MARAAEPELEPGRAYRTRDLRRWSTNPTRLAKQLVNEGRLLKAAHGLFYAPVQSRFGRAPVSDTELLRAFLGGSPFIISGPLKWNALGLGSKAMFPVTLVYNTKRTGEFMFDGKRYLLRRVLFPKDPPPEYFVVDLIEHHAMAGISSSDLERGLEIALRNGRWSTSTLKEMAERYGRRRTQSLVERCIQAASKHGKQGR